MNVKAIFKAKVSWWIFLPIYALFLYFAILGIIDEKWSIVLIMAITAVIFLNLTLFTRYIVTLKDELFIQIGWFGGYKILISDILSIEKTRIALASPAPSLDRIQINYGKYSSVIISPADKLAFIKFLREINPNISLKPPLDRNCRN